MEVVEAVDFSAFPSASIDFAFTATASPSASIDFVFTASASASASMIKDRFRVLPLPLPPLWFELSNLSFLTQDKRLIGPGLLQYV